MAKTIYVNLPVADVAKAAAFYEAIGFERNPEFSNAQAAALSWSDTIRVMLMSHDFFTQLSGRKVHDTHAGSTAMFALGLDTRAEVDAISEAAIAAGGREIHGPEDEGFMYSRAFEDLDGHGFGPVWMDMSAMASAA